VVFLIKAPTGSKVHPSLRAALESWLATLGIEAPITVGKDEIELDMKGCTKAEHRFIQRNLDKTGYVVEVLI